MKTFNEFILLTVASILLLSCSNVDSRENTTQITIESPSPTEQITKVALNDVQMKYIEAENNMAFRLLAQLYKGDNLVCAPLSLQYAMTMLANGSSNETLEEIIDFLGYGKEGVEALNDFNKTLIEQLPALDLGVRFKATNALLANAQYTLLPTFKNTLEDYYYAAVESADFSKPEEISSRINSWANRSTDGFVDKLIDPSEISSDAMLYIMNALYFKATWKEDDLGSMFNDKFTKSEDFNLSDGEVKKVDMMRNTKYHQYAEMDGYKVLALPYSEGLYNMYILLPDENDISGLVTRLQSQSWTEILKSFKQDAEVSVLLPKFEINKTHDLSDALKELGVQRAFYNAEFDRLFENQGSEYVVGRVIQKSRIAVTEAGTETGSVTIIGNPISGEPDDNTKKIDFHAVHPFVFVIGEGTTGTILYAGVFSKP